MSKPTQTAQDQDTPEHRAAVANRLLFGPTSTVKLPELPRKFDRRERRTVNIDVDLHSLLERMEYKTIGSLVEEAARLWLYVYTDEVVNKRRPEKRVVHLSSDVLKLRHVEGLTGWDEWTLVRMAVHVLIELATKVVGEATLLDRMQEMALEDERTIAETIADTLEAGLRAQ